MKSNRIWRLWLPTLLIMAGAADCRPRFENFIIICAGDSLTARGYPVFLRGELRRESIKARILNYGRSGFTTTEYLTFLRSREIEMKAKQPDIILLELGTNDVRVDGDHVSGEEFKRNMEEIIAVFHGFRSRRGGRPAVFLASIPPIPEKTPYPFSEESVRRVALEINPIIRVLCEKEKAVFVDNYALFHESPGLLPEVHPSPEGYGAMAANWLKAIKKEMKIQ